MAYKVFNAEGKLVAGDAVLDDVVKAAALMVDGYVEDDAGEKVYESPGYAEHLEAEKRAAEVAAAAAEADAEE